MTRAVSRYLSLAFVVVLAACASEKAAERSEAAPSTREPADGATAPTAAAPPAASAAKPPRPVRLLITTDEHGWIDAFVDRAAGEKRGGVIQAYRRFIDDEGLERDPTVALFSAGDMWTGPYETTILEGAPMLAAFNRMGYRASAIGNHEFDFGVKVLERRATEAKFPFLGANIREAASGAMPTWSKPFVITEVGGVKLGVIGLAHQKSPETTDPRHLVGLEFLDYEATLDEVVPQARAAGAEELLVLMHDRISVVHAVLPAIRRHGIHVVGAGHAHEAGLFIDNGGTPADVGDDVVVCNAGPYLRSYCRIDVTFGDGALVERNASIQQIASSLTDDDATGDPELKKIVEDTRARADKLGNEVLTTSKRTLSRKDTSLGQFIVDSWVEALPYAEVAITNAGGLRQDLAKGPIRLRDVVSVMPFNNYLLVVEISGAELRQVLANPESIAAGVRYTYRDTPSGRIILDVSDRSGKAITDDQRVKVIINDFMYRGGDRYAFLSFDSEPEETAIDWREPVLRELRRLGREKVVLDRGVDDRARKVD